MLIWYSTTGKFELRAGFIISLGLPIESEFGHLLTCEANNSA